MTIGKGQVAEENCEENCRQNFRQVNLNVIWTLPDGNQTFANVEDDGEELRARRKTTLLVCMTKLLTTLPILTL